MKIMDKLKLDNDTKKTPMVIIDDKKKSEDKQAFVVNKRKSVSEF